MNATMTPIRRLALSTAAVLVLLGIAACGDDTVVTPVFGEGCSAGDLRIGTAKGGALSEESPCVEERHFWTSYRSAYDAYSVRLEAGKAYVFRLERRPDARREGRDNLDALLSIFGRDEAGVVRPFALSDDEGGDRDSELLFVAPRTGTFQVVAGMYGSVDDVDDLGGYLLTSAECPVLDRITGIGTRAFELAPSACIRTRAGTGDVPATYRFVTIDAEPNQRITVAVDADEFQPAWELYGPAQDAFANLYDESQHRAFTANGQGIIDVGPRGGQVTLALGRLGGDGNEFEVTVTRAPRPVLVSAVQAAGRPALKTAPGKMR
jgi:hypothetical protein